MQGTKQSAKGERQQRVRAHCNTERPSLTAERNVAGWGKSVMVIAALMLLCQPACLAQYGGGRGAADLNIPARVSASDPTLQRAVDAYRQARQLDHSLKKSERAVEAQTKQLRGQLRSSEAVEAVNSDPSFTAEVGLDKQLLGQAESETRRDKRLVQQAEQEMSGDKAFLEAAYRKDKRAGRSGESCPSADCSMARDEGSLPRSCVDTTGVDCPRISCYDYQEAGECEGGSVCVRPGHATVGCTLPSSTGLSWMRAKCPGLLCSRAQAGGYTPQFCTVTDLSTPCPLLDCFQYTDLGGCQGPAAQGFSLGGVCAKPAAADVLCKGGNGGGGKRQSMDGVSPLHDAHAAKSEWSHPENVEDRMVLLLLLLLLSMAAGGAYFIFRRHGGALGRPKKPAPVPAYYGRL